jgi:hypothetical protein
MSGAWTGDPVSSFTGPGTPILVSVVAAAVDGSHLVLTQGAPAWQEVVIEVDLDGVSNVSAPANTPVGKVLGTTAVGQWGPVDVWQRWTGTQAQYDALPVKDPGTLYAITS